MHSLAGSFPQTFGKYLQKEFRVGEDRDRWEIAFPVVQAWWREAACMQKRHQAPPKSYTMGNKSLWRGAADPAEHKRKPAKGQEKCQNTNPSSWSGEVNRARSRSYTNTTEGLAHKSCTKDTGRVWFPQGRGTAPVRKTQTKHAGTEACLRLRFDQVHGEPNNLNHPDSMKQEIRVYHWERDKSIRDTPSVKRHTEKA